MKTKLESFDAKAALSKAISSSIHDLENKIKDYTSTADKLALEESRVFFRKRIDEYTKAIEELKSWL